MGCQRRDRTRKIRRWRAHGLGGCEGGRYADSRANAAKSRTIISSVYESVRSRFSVRVRKDEAVAACPGSLDLLRASVPLQSPAQSVFKAHLRRVAKVANGDRRVSLGVADIAGAGRSVNGGDRERLQTSGEDSTPDLT